MKKIKIFLPLTLLLILSQSCDWLTSSNEICHYFKASINWNQQANTLTAVTSGGDPPFFYKWSTGVNDLSEITVTGPGTYSVTVTDFGECNAYANFTIK
ncbi:MAG: hypothetical protein IPP06_15335 [Saprospiraceae bacterium]|nr:hypothetical protein [Candidatus Vicinibacter affinis]